MHTYMTTVFKSDIAQEGSALTHDLEVLSSLLESGVIPSLLHLIDLPYFFGHTSLLLSHSTTAKSSFTHI